MHYNVGSYDLLYVERVRELGEIRRIYHFCLVHSSYIKNPEVFNVEGGMVKTLEGPGLGIEMNEELIRKVAEESKDYSWRNPGISFSSTSLVFFAIARADDLGFSLAWRGWLDQGVVDADFGCQRPSEPGILRYIVVHVLREKKFGRRALCEGQGQYKRVKAGARRPSSSPSSRFTLFHRGSKASCLRSTYIAITSWYQKSSEETMLLVLLLAPCMQVCI